MEVQFSIISTALVLGFVLDPFGNVPLVLALLKDFEPKKRFRIIVREVFIGLVILLAFLLAMVFSAYFILRQKRSLLLEG